MKKLSPGAKDMEVLKALAANTVRYVKWFKLRVKLFPANEKEFYKEKIERQIALIEKHTKSIKYGTKTKEKSK